MFGGRPSTLYISNLATKAHASDTLLGQIGRAIPSAIILTGANIYLRGIRRRLDVTSNYIATAAFGGSNIFTGFISRTQIDRFVRGIRRVHQWSKSGRDTCPQRETVALLQSLPPSSGMSAKVTAELAQVNVRSAASSWQCWVNANAAWDRQLTSNHKGHRPPTNDL